MSDPIDLSQYDLTDYRAFGPFMTLYHSAYDRIYHDYDVKPARNLVTVLMAVVKHAGPLGTCYRLSVRRLMAVAHMRHEGVREQIERLAFDLKWLREHRTFIPSRGVEQVDWQLSPFVVWIQRDNVQQAITLWNAAQTPVRAALFAAPNSHNVSAGETQSESEPESETRSETSGESRYRTSSGHTGNGRSRFQWREIPIDNCKAPIANQLQESNAQLIAKHVGTNISQARQMILTYGVDKVMRELTRVQEKQAAGRVANAGALLLTYVRTAHGTKVQPELAQFERGAD